MSVEQEFITANISLFFSQKHAVLEERQAYPHDISV